MDILKNIIDCVIDLVLDYRNTVSVRENTKVDKLIKSDIEAQSKIKRVQERINRVQVNSDIISLYNLIYSKYESDALFGLYDWSPSITTMIVDMKDDCDGMSVVWEALAKKYCEVNGHGFIKTNSVSFIHGNVFDIPKAHVMCVTETTNGYILFDYTKANIFNSYNEMKEYYRKTYLNKPVKLENIRTRVLPSYKGCEITI